jgi:hypothetical protein
MLLITIVAVDFPSVYWVGYMNFSVLPMHTCCLICNTPTSFLLALSKYIIAFFAFIDHLVSVL